ncbi:glycine--tRNA ligase [Streptomyces sp. ME03-5709C]|nr:glycine--tRNA ligase [Streptomyces sp. ME03-5709C]
MQEALSRLSTYWAGRGCLTVQPMNTEVGAGTLNPATALRVLGPEPWRAAYVEPSVRPDDARYGKNPNRMQCHTQFQVILKPDPGDAIDQYLASLEALGVDTRAHDIRFVEDNWASPALGAWGLGWEVWLDGLEITQFTYFQQAGGVVLETPAVEITYGMERILMALQGVRHFKEIAYAPGIAYGEIVGQAEYEMSRYFLDDADVESTRELLELNAREARRCIDAGLAIPAHAFVAKLSHAFNILDSRGAVSTAERQVEFARMRQLSNEIARLWLAKREEAGFPLGVASAPAAPPTEAADAPADLPSSTADVVFEIGVEEMPPAEAAAARDSVEALLVQRLAGGRLRYGDVTVHATARRIVATVTDVAGREDDRTREVRGPRVSAAFDTSGAATRAAEGFARAQGVEVGDLGRVTVDGVAYVAASCYEPGRPAAQRLAEVLAEIVGGLRGAKNMRWNNPGLSFTRPVRWLLALHGSRVVPVSIANLASGRTTVLNRCDDNPVVPVPSADAFPGILAEAGIVVDASQRRAAILSAAEALAAQAGGRLAQEGLAALVDQLCFLVEQPMAILGSFDPGYLRLPTAVLSTVMRKHQRYLPIVSAQGALLPHFVVIANGPVDEDLVRAGNEAVLRARFEDAAYFHSVDSATPVTEMRGRLTRLSFTDKLGSMADRAERISAVALALSEAVGLEHAQTAVLRRAAELVKFDLGSHTVVELTSLVGTMAHHYALASGESTEVAQALLETELPRTGAGAPPTSPAGALLALADRLDLLVGLAATVGLPAGSSDPFALRRAALGVLAILRSPVVPTDLDVRDAVYAAAQVQPVAAGEDVCSAVVDFVVKRLEQLQLEAGYAADRVRAVRCHATRPRLADRLLAQLDAAHRQGELAGPVAALQRVRRILPADAVAGYRAGDLVENAEVRLHEALTRAVAATGDVIDVEVFIGQVAPLVGLVDDFFDQVMVNHEDPALRAARWGLLASVRDFGARQLDWAALLV